MNEASAEPTSARIIRVGLISDTHSLLRPDALESLAGSDFIVHAGDIGNAGILEQLAAIAPVTAVRGNNDVSAWAEAIPETDVLQAGEVFIYVIHDLGQLEIDPAAGGFHVVVSGHSHRPMYERREGVLYINPGSAGPRRFSLPITVGQLLVSGIEVSPQLIELNLSVSNREKRSS
jgi:putative phosphoesterase